MHKRLIFLSIFLVVFLAACGGGGGSVSNPTAPEGYEIYTENGGVPRPADAVDVFIVYAPESQEYMPELIRQFNQSYADGTNPVTGQPLADGERPIYVWGTDPVEGSSGTVKDGIVNAITNPNAQNVYRPTIFQPSVGHWLALANFESRREVFDLADARGVALSPVVIATWESRLNAIMRVTGKSRDELGWQDFIDVFNSENGWCDYGLEDCRRAVYYGHADPNHSSTGLSTTIAQYYACARDNGFTDRRLSVAAVDDDGVQECVSDIQDLTRHYSRRTEDFLEYVGQGPNYLDFLAMEETDVICINSGGSQGDIPCVRPPRGERLVAIYPAEGTYWHEHPFGIVNAEWVSEDQRNASRLFTDWMLTRDVQQQIMGYGYRPAHPDVSLDFPFVEENGVTLQGPTSTLDVPEPEAVVEIQETWQSVKKQADVLILVDVSGSMAEEDKLVQAKQGIDILIDNMPASNRVAMVSFNEIVTIWDPLRFAEITGPTIRAHATCENMEVLGNQIYTIPFRKSCLQAAGGTSLYTATRIGVDILDSLSSGEDRIRLVLLLSDGQDTCEAEGCSTLDDVTGKIARTYDSANPVIVIPVAYGRGADMEALGAIADASRTNVISGDPSNILEILTLLSGYF